MTSQGDHLSSSRLGSPAGNGGTVAHTGMTRPSSGMSGGMMNGMISNNGMLGCATSSSHPSPGSMLGDRQGGSMMSSGVGAGGIMAPNGGGGAAPALGGGVSSHPPALKGSNPPTGTGGGGGSNVQLGLTAVGGGSISSSGPMSGNGPGLPPTGGIGPHGGAGLLGCGGGSGQSAVPPGSNLLPGGDGDNALRSRMFPASSFPANASRPPRPAPMHASVSSFGGSGGGKAPRPPMRDSAPSGIFPQASSMQQMSGNMQLASNGMGSGISGVNPGAAHLPPHAINGLEGAACPPHSFPPQHLNPGAGAMHPPGNTYSGPPSMGSNVDAPSMGSHPHGLSAAPVSGMTGPPGGGSVSSRGGYNVGPSAGSSRYHDAYNPEPRTAGDRRTDHYTGGGKELHMSGYAGGGGGKDYLGSHGGGKDYSEHPPRGKGGRKARNKGEHDYYDYRDRDGARGGDRMSGGPFGDQGGGYGSRGLKNNIISCPKRPVPLSAPTLVVPWAARPNACADLTSDEDDELLEIMMSPRRNMQLRLYYPQASMSAGFEQQLDEYERTGRIPHGTSMQTMVGGTNPRKRGEPLKLTAEGAIDWETDRDRGVPEDYKEFNGHAISQFKLDGDEDSQQVVPRGMKGQGRHNHRGAYNYDIPPMDGGASYYIGPQDVSHQLSFFRDPGLDPNPGTVWELYEDRGTVSIISDRDTVTWGAGPTMENYLEPWRYGLGGYGYSTGYGGYRGYNSASSDTRGGASMSGAGGSSGSTSSSYARAPDTRPPRSDRGGDMRKSDVPRKSEYSALPPREDQRQHQQQQQQQQWTSSSRRGENPAWQGRSRESGYSRENFYGGGGGQQDYSSGRPSTSSSGGYGKGRKQYPAPESSSTLVAKEQLNTSNVTAERTTSSLAYQ